MLFRRPCYYDEFTCIADRCTDNCCIGWEICIDSATAELYKAVKGDFGERLSKSITDSDEPSFILNGERCPFLNNRNLCDIISTLGEDYLCQICRDHPRYFEWYGKEKEGGIGLSCQEAARLILESENFADYFESEVDDYPDEDFDEDGYLFIFGVREAIFDILLQKDKSFRNRAEEILRLCSEAEVRLSGAESKSLLSFDFHREFEKAKTILEKTEPIDESWTKCFGKLKCFSPDFSLSKKEEEYLTRLFAYFVWRYFLTAVFDYRVTEKVRFALFSVTVIFALYRLEGDESFEALVKSAVLYSKQMEYSSENLDIFFSLSIKMQEQ